MSPHWLAQSHLGIVLPAPPPAPPQPRAPHAPAMSDTAVDTSAEICAKVSPGARLASRCSSPLCLYFYLFFFFFSLLAQTCGSHFGFLIFFFKSYLFFFPCNLSLLRPRSSRSAIRRGSSAAVRCRAELPAPRSFVSRVRETCSGPAPRRGRPAPGGREGAAGGWGASSARFVLLAVGTDSAGKVGAVGRGIFFIFFFGGVGGMID